MLLTKRLSVVAEFVRPGSRVADVGSDHAKLPVYLIEKGIASGCLASDVNAGPAQRSEKAVRAHGLSDRIRVTVADGLCGIEDFRPDDIVIAGMGGELIWRIISESGYVLKKDVRLILQPMTKAVFLRRKLYENGFDIINERLVEDGKIYQIISAVYTGTVRSVPEEILILGEMNIKNRDPLLEKHAAAAVSAIEKRICGLERSGADTAAETALRDAVGSAIKFGNDENDENSQ